MYENGLGSLYPGNFGSGENRYLNHRITSHMYIVSACRRARLQKITRLNLCTRSATMAAPLFGGIVVVGLVSVAYKALQARRNKNVLIVITSHEQFGNTGEKTGFWLEELAAPYYALKDAGFEVVFASPKGGKPPVDPNSEKSENQTESTKRWYADDEAKARLDKTLKLSDIDEKDFAAVFFPGGHGPLYDLAEDPNSFWLIEKFDRSRKPIAAVCHGPAVFKKTPHVVKGKTITGFSDAEESIVGAQNAVPFSLEQVLKGHGAKFTAGKPWASHVVVSEDGLLITGQNPASSVGVGNELVKRLKRL